MNRVLDSLYKLSQLREFIKDSPDDTPIRCQVVAKDGGAWNMWCGIHTDGQYYTLRVYHEDLGSLPSLPIEAKQWFKLRAVWPTPHWYVAEISASNVHLITSDGAERHISLPTFMKLYEEV